MSKHRVHLHHNNRWHTYECADHDSAIILFRLIKLPKGATLEMWRDTTLLATFRA